MQPAVDVYYLRSGFCILVIAQHKVGFSARSELQGFPTAGADDRTTFRHTVGNGIGESYLFEETFHIGIERRATDNDFIEVTAENIHCFLAHIGLYLVIDNRHPQQ